MFKRLRMRIRYCIVCAADKWRTTLQGRSAIYFRDAWHDYWQTLKEATEERTFPQLMAALSLVAVILLLHMIIWACLSTVFGFLIMLAWNESVAALLPTYLNLDYTPPPLTWFQGWALSFLGILVFFRNIKIELNIKNRRSE